MAESSMGQPMLMGNEMEGVLNPMPNTLRPTFNRFLQLQDNERGNSTYSNLDIEGNRY